MRSKEQVLERNAFGEKQCTGCLEWLPESEYDADLRTASDKLKCRCRACVRFARYKLTRVDVIDMLAMQNNRCPICSKRLLGMKSFAVDHDHQCCSGETKLCGQCNRGLVCVRCNVVVLSTVENEELLIRAQAYVRSYRA